MKDWIAVHNDMEGDVAIIRKDSITYVGTDNETGGTVIHTNNFMYAVREAILILLGGYWNNEEQLTPRRLLETSSGKRQRYN